MVQGGFLSGEQRAHLEALVRRPTERHGIARRANAMLLLDDGLSCEAVARVLYLDDDTVRGWHDRFRREGVRALSVFGWKGGASKLTPAQEAELTETLTRRLFPSTAAVMAHIERAYGVAYSKPGAIKLLHRLGSSGASPRGCPPAPMSPRKRPSSPPTRRCSTVSRPTRPSISPMRCIRSTRAGPPMAGSGRASIWRSGAARAACG